MEMVERGEDATTGHHHYPFSHP
ncbi:BnaC04g19360D [Brassica napus]|uniref:BnaC04g19360D protein n=1 Tax=Brassica napus TaxID=3708 RepID=A0A078F6A3_BRANA|nr:BnaC04g19360D [Brassica napus]